MLDNLLIIGAGQYGFIAKETAQALNCYSEINFVDDNNPSAVGKISDLEKLLDKYKFATVAIGNPVIRIGLINKLKEIGYKVPALVHPMAYVSVSAIISDGCIIEPFAVVQANSHVGLGCLVSSGSVINHNCTVGDVCHIDCNATVGSNVTLSSGSKVSYGEVVTP